MYNTMRNIANAVILLCLAIPSYAAPRSKASILKAAKRTLNAGIGKNKTRAVSGAELKILKETDAFTVVGTASGGFAIISNDDLLPEVIGYSQGRFANSEENTNFRWYLQAAENAIRNVVTHGTPLKIIKPDPNKYAQKIDAFVTTKWGQQDPYNRLCPTAGKNGSTPGQNYNGGEKAVTGCVATAMAQIIRYNMYPKTGTGSNTLSVKQADSTRMEFTVDFSTSHYRWNEMQDIYKKGAFSDEAGNAVALLMRDCGFASNMNYGSDVSGTPITEAYAGLKKYFNYPETMKLVHRIDYLSKDAEWMDMIYKEMNARRAIFFGAGDKNPYNGGHAFVFCGYNEEGKVYVNWGWNGEDDGYYDVNLLNPGAYQFSQNQSMIIGFAPDRPQRNKQLTVEVSAAGTLAEQIVPETLETLQSLTVNGNLNSTDFKYLRRLTGRDAFGKAVDGGVETLDLSGATVVAGGEAFLIDGDKQLTTKANEIPERAFFGCHSLKKLLLPASITQIGDGAFGQLTNLKEIAIPEGEDKQYTLKNNILYSKDGSELIAVLPLVVRKLIVDEGIKKIHPYGFAGCQRLTDIVLPATIEEIGSNAFEGSYAYNSIKVYAKTPCKLGTDAFADINKSITKLYVPLHSEEKYKGAEQWKDFYKTYDNIQPFGTDIFVSTATRTYGEANPEFGYRFEGDDFIGEPILTCDAAVTSDAGEYEIKIQRGSIVSDMLQLFAGKLVITKAEATLTVENAEVMEGTPYTPTYQITRLRNGETTCKLTRAPKFIYKDAAGNEVSSLDRAGDYTVIAMGAEAKNYVFNYVAGSVTVKGNPTGIVERESTGAGDTPYYTVGGMRIDKPRKGGVYIYKGKKVIIR